MTPLGIKLANRFNAETLYRHSTPEGPIYWIDSSYESNANSARGHTWLRRMAPAPETLNVDGKPRLAYPCLSWSWTFELTPVTWDGAMLGHQGKGERLPLYIQRHAVEQWKRRLPEKYRSYLDFKIALDRPTVVHGTNGVPLLGYSFGDYRVGYFVLSVVDKIVLLRSFLFLTMKGTPEAELLRTKLRLHRPDIEYHGLHELGTFLTSDLHQDPELVAPLGQCNLAHLLELRDERNDVVRKGFAASLRKYLRLVA